MQKAQSIYLISEIFKMKQLNQREQTFLNTLIVELVTIAHSFKSDDIILRTCEGEILDDEYGVKHLLVSFGCSLPENAKLYRSVFNKKMSEYKKANDLTFSNNSFICELFRIAEQLAANSKLTMTLVGHGVSVFKHRSKGEAANVVPEILPGNSVEVTSLWPRAGHPAAYSDFEIAARSGLQNGCFSTQSLDEGI